MTSRGNAVLKSCLRNVSSSYCFEMDKLFTKSDLGFVHIESNADDK